MVTIVLTMAGFFGMRPHFVLSLNWYSAIISPDIFPVNGIYLPVFVSSAYIPRRSASGSVARTMSAFFSFASLRASSNAFGSSGFGYSSVVNSGSGSSCSGTMYTFLKPSSDRTLFTGTRPVPWNGVYTILMFTDCSLMISG